MVDLDKERPAIVISSDAINRHSLDVCLIPVSKSDHKAFSLRPKLKKGEAGLDFDSWAKCDQVFTVEKKRVVYPPIGTLCNSALTAIEQAVRDSLELNVKPIATVQAVK